MLERKVFYLVSCPLASARASSSQVFGGSLGLPKFCNYNVNFPSKGTQIFCKQKLLNDVKHLCILSGNFVESSCHSTRHSEQDENNENAVDLTEAPLAPLASGLTIISFVGETPAHNFA